MPTVTAAQAAVLTSTTQVATSRGRCQHLLVETRHALTRLGKVRRGHHPVCGALSHRWRRTSAEQAPRPLCRRCLTWAIRRHPSLANPYLFPDITPAEVHAALDRVTDPTELHRLVYAICSRADLVHHIVTDPFYGNRRRLTAYVPAARLRCATPSTSPVRSRS